MRACIGVLLTAALVWYLEPAVVFGRIRNVEIWALVLACAILAAQYTLAAMRWCFVLRRHGIGLPAVQVLAVFGAGALGNAVALTAVAGMSVRGLLLLRFGVAASRVVGVLLVERAAAATGFATAITAGFAATSFLRDTDGGLRLPSPAAVLIPLAAAAAVALYWALRRRHVAMQFLSDIRASFLTPVVVAGLAGLSCTIVWLGFAAVAMLARGMGLQVSVIFFLAVMPVVALLSALPVSIGGWGVREGAMVAGLLLFGVPADAGAALSITYGALGMGITFTLGGASAVLLRPLDRNR